MNEPKWKTTVLGVLGAILTVLVFVAPDIFTAENNATLVQAVSGILTGVLSIIAIFSAKDTIDPNNIK